MATQAKAAYGIALKLGTATVPELVSLSDVGGQFGVVETSAHDGNGWTSRIPTLLDGGVVRAVLNFVPADPTQVALKTAMLARASSAMSVVFPGGTPTWTFNAFVTSYRIPTAGVSDPLRLNVDLQVDGPITMA
jgi:hypothetical protein